MKNYNSTLSEFLFFFDEVIIGKYGKNLTKDEDFYLFLNCESYALGFVLAYHYYDKFLYNLYKVKWDLLSLTHDTKFMNKFYLLANYDLKKEDILKPKLLVNHMNDFD